MIAYLHGYNGTYTESNDRVKMLAACGRGVYGISYKSTDRRGDIVSHILNNEIRRGTTAIAGNSLGGYFAATLAALLECPAVLINPALNPYHFLKCIGQDDLAVSYRCAYIPCNYKIPPCVLLDDGDEVFDAISTAKYFFNVANPLKVYSGGCHAFAHSAEATPLVAEYLNKYEKY